jgi:hypothetical protein
VPAGHLVALGDLPLLSDADSDHLVDTGRKLVVGLVVPAKRLDIDDLAVNPVRHTE